MDPYTLHVYIELMVYVLQLALFPDQLVAAGECMESGNEVPAMLINAVPCVNRGNLGASKVTFSKVKTHRAHNPSTQLPPLFSNNYPSLDKHAPCILGWVVGFGRRTPAPPTTQSLVNQGALTLLSVSPGPRPLGGPGPQP